MLALIFDPVISLPLVALFALSALGLAGWSYLALTNLSSKRWRALLIGLRVLAIAIVTVILLGPARARSEKFVEKAPITFLLDRSKSMEIPDMRGGATRATALRETLALNRSAIEKLAAAYQVSAMDFGATAAPVEIEKLWSEAARDEAFRFRTDLGGALNSAVAEMKGRTNGTVILLTDGRSNGPRDPLAAAASFKSRGISIYAVPLGQQTESDAIKDVKVVNVIAPTQARLNTTVTLDAELSALGLSGRTLNVTLKVDGKAVGNKQCVPAQMKETLRVGFQMMATPLGQHEIAVDVAPIPGEIDTDNNHFTTLLRVEDERMRVVYLEGRLRWEYRYLRDFLRGLRMVDAEFYNCFDDGPLPDEAFTLSARSVVIIGDIAASRFSKEQIEKLQNAVETGAGLIVLGGLKNLGPGEYGATPLAELLPVVVGKNDTQLDESFRLRLAPDAPNHYAIRLDVSAEKTAERWNKLAPLDGRVSTGPLKPAAMPLLIAQPLPPTSSAPSTQLQQTAPRTILAGLNYSKGRTLVLTADTTWKWAVGPADERETYRCFWQQVIGWLGRWDELHAASFFLRLPRYRFLRDEAVEIAADLSSAGKPLPDCPASLLIRSPSGREEKLQPGFFSGAYQSVYYPKESGRYSLRGFAETKDGKKLTSDEMQFLVTLPDPELDTPLANHDLLKQIAEASGGKLVPREELPKLLERFVSEDRSTTVQRTLAPQPLWDRPLTLLLFCGLLTLEWTLRRYKRLV
ncbi:MAG TPA: VWA domain-containing protein [Planctomycetota bacterium]|jgi:hypothetical protein